MPTRHGLAGLLILALPLLPGRAQPAAVLHITVTVPDGDVQDAPVPRYALLITDDPESAPPTRIMTGPDGTADVPLRPGRYTVESDEPLILRGRAYQWRQTLNVPAGRTTRVDLTAANAETTAAPNVPPVPGTPSASAAGSPALSMEWQSSVVTIWTLTSRGSGFLVDPGGFIATSRELAASGGALEVQLSATVKVAGRVVAADPDTQLAILRVDPAAVAGVRPVRLAAGGAADPAEGDAVAVLTAPASRGARVLEGRVVRMTPGSLLSDIRVDRDGPGAPVFNRAGDVVGIVAAGDERASSESAACARCGSTNCGRFSRSPRRPCRGGRHRTGRGCRWSRGAPSTNRPCSRHCVDGRRLRLPTG